MKNSKRVENCIRRFGGTREGVRAAFLSGEIHCLKNIGQKTVIELSKWAGCPELEKPISIRKPTETIKRAIHLLRRHGYIVILRGDEMTGNEE